METGKELFESIMNSCPRKKVVSLCKKLIKKCSFNSGEDARNLCSLGYRLFIYGHIDEALAVSRYTHNVPFPGRGVFNVWTFILCLWGLEVFILKAQGKYEEADVRIISPISGNPGGLLAVARGDRFLCACFMSLSS